MQTPAAGSRYAAGYSTLGRHPDTVDRFLISNASKQKSLATTLGTSSSARPKHSSPPTSQRLTGTLAEKNLSQSKQQQQALSSSSSLKGRLGISSDDSSYLQTEIERLKRKLNSVITSAEEVLGEASTAQDEAKAQYESQLSLLEAQINTLLSDGSFLRRKLEVACNDLERERRRVKVLEKDLMDERGRRAQPSFVSTASETTSQLTVHELPESGLRRLVLQLQDELEERNNRLSVLTQGHALTQAQLATSRIETVQALLLLERLAQADEVLNPNSSRRWNGAPNFSNSDEDGDGASCEDSMLDDSLEVADLQVLPRVASATAPAHMGKRGSRARVAHIPSSSEPEFRLKLRIQERHEAAVLAELRQAGKGPRSDGAGSAEVEEIHEIWQSAGDGVMPLSELLERLARRVAMVVDSAASVTGSKEDCSPRAEEASEEVKQIAPSKSSELETELLAARVERQHIESLFSSRVLEANARVQEAEAKTVELAQQLAASLQQAQRVPGLSAQVAELDATRAMLEEANSQCRALVQENVSLEHQLCAQEAETIARDDSIQALLQDNRDKVAALERSHALQLSDLALRHDSALFEQIREHEALVERTREDALQGLQELEASRLELQSELTRSRELLHAHETHTNATVAELLQQVALLRASLEDQIQTSVANFSLQSVVAGERDNALALAEHRERERAALEVQLATEREAAAKKLRDAELEMVGLSAANSELVMRVRGFDNRLTASSVQLRNDFAQRLDEHEKLRLALELQLRDARAGEALAQAALVHARTESERQAQLHAAERDQSQQRMQDVADVHAHATAQLRADFGALQRQLATTEAALRNQEQADDAVSAETQADVLIHRSDAEPGVSTNVELEMRLQRAQVEADAQRTAAADLRQRALSAEHAVAASRASETRLEQQLLRTQAAASVMEAELKVLHEEQADMANAHREDCAALETAQALCAEQHANLLSVRAELDSRAAELQAARQALASSEAGARIARHEVLRLRGSHEALARDRGRLLAELAATSEAIPVRESVYDNGTDREERELQPPQQQQQLLEQLRAQRASDAAQLAELRQQLSRASEERDQASRTLLRVDAEAGAMWSAESRALAEQVRALQAQLSEARDSAHALRAQWAGKSPYSASVAIPGAPEAGVAELEALLRTEQGERRLVVQRAEQLEQSEHQLRAERGELRARCLELERECAALHGHATTATDCARDKERELGEQLRAQAAVAAALQVEREELRARAELAEAAAAEAQAQAEAAAEQLAQLSARQGGERVSASLQQQRTAQTLQTSRLTELEQRLRDAQAAARTQEQALRAQTLVDAAGRAERERLERQVRRLQEQLDRTALMLGADSTAVRTPPSRSLSPSPLASPVRSKSTTSPAPAPSVASAINASSRERAHDSEAKLARALAALSAQSAQAAAAQRRETDLRQAAEAEAAAERDAKELLVAQVQRLQEQLQQAETDEVAVTHPLAPAGAAASDEEREQYTRLVGELSAALSAQAAAQRDAQRENAELRARLTQLLRAGTSSAAHVAVSLPQPGGRASGSSDTVVPRAKAQSSHSGATYEASDDDDDQEDDEEEEGDPQGRGPPCVVFDFDDAQPGEGEGEGEHSVQTGRGSSASGRRMRAREQRRAEVRRSAELGEERDQLRRENALLAERLRGLLAHNFPPDSFRPPPVAVSGGGGAAAAVANASWALRAVQLAGDDCGGGEAEAGAVAGTGSSPGSAQPLARTSMGFAFSPLSRGVDSSSRLSPRQVEAQGKRQGGAPAPAPDSSEQLRELQDELAVARRNAKASTAAAHRLSAEAQSQLAALRAELGDRTERCAELLRQNEALAAHLREAEDEYLAASRTLLDTADGQRRAQQARLEALRGRLARAKTVARSLAVKLRSERARHREELGALRTRLRVAARAEGLSESLWGGDESDDELTGLEAASDDDASGDADSLATGLSLSSDDGKGEC